MGFFDFLFKKKDAKESDSYDEHCENCGELLEDCECEDQHISKEDISQPFSLDELIFFDEMDEDD